MRFRRSSNDEAPRRSSAGRSPRPARPGRRTSPSTDRWPAGTWRAIDLAAERVSGVWGPTLSAFAKATADRRSFSGCWSGSASLEHEGIGANVLGDPRVALTWLVNELSQLGLTLRAGQVV